MTTFTLKGDGRDSREKFEDFLRALISEHNVGIFQDDDFDADEPFSAENESTKFKQQASIGRMNTALINIAEPESTLRRIVRNVETSRSFATPVQKMRKFISLYREQVQPNPEKNSILNEQRNNIFLKLSSEIDLKRDVEKMLNEIDTVEDEMEKHMKWSAVLKMETIINLLRPVEDLNHFFHNQEIYHSEATYDKFRSNLLTACAGIADRKRNQKDTRRPRSDSIMSANSITITDSLNPSQQNSTTSQDTADYKEFQDFKRQKQSQRLRSNSQDR
jgi:hypothetical protein